MADPFLSEIRIASFAYAPKGWALCQGQILPINQNQALFSLLGITYGGNGQTTFALPDLRGRAAIHSGPGFQLGSTGGATTHTLTAAEADHQHPLTATGNQATSASPVGALLAAKPRGGKNIYHSAAGDHALDAATVTPVGGGNANGVAQPHDNVQPFIHVNFIIALQGIFPSRNS